MINIRPVLESENRDVATIATAAFAQVSILPSYESWMTGRLVYHDVCLEHDSSALRDPELTTIERALGVTP